MKIDVKLQDFCVVIGPNILTNIKNIITSGMQFSEMKYLDF